MADILENADANLAPQMRNPINILWSEWKTVEQQIKELTEQLERISDADAGCTRIRQIPGIGPMMATAIVAAIGNGAAFRKGRDFAAWLRVVPRQYSTGGKAKLLGISKRGNVYLRKVLIHGARVAVLRTKRDRAAIGPWSDRLDARAPKILWWWPRLISWHASHGPSCLAVKTTDPRRPSQPPKVRVPVKETYPRIQSTHRSLHRNSNDERTVTTACLQPDTENGLLRPTDLLGQACSGTHRGQERRSPLEGRIHCRRLVSRP